MAPSQSRQTPPPEGPHPGRITTPAGSTIEAVEGGYRVCDARRHCLQAPSLWEAQQLVQWSEVHHLPLGDESERSNLRG
jgi:hypothetical protein